MVDEGFVVHLADEHRYGLGVAAFEVGSGYARQEPLQRLARRPLAALVDEVGHSAHLVVLHGRDVLYVLEERAPGRPPLVTDVGVRLPAHLTASGRAILAAAPACPGAGALPGPVGVRRPAPASARPRSPRSGSCCPRRGSAATPPRTGEVTPGLASVASAVLDHNGHPVAGVAVTFPEGIAPAPIATAVRSTALKLTRRLSGH